MLLSFVFFLAGCNHKPSQKATDLINASDYCLIYKYDTADSDALLYHMPALDSIDYIKQLIIHKGNFRKGQLISPDYRIDLYENDSLCAEVMIELSDNPMLILRFDSLEVSRKVDYQLSMYLSGIEQEVETSISDKEITFRKDGYLNNRLFGFAKYEDEDHYSNIFIKRYFDTELNASIHNLETLLKELDAFWEVVKRYSPIELSSASIGYPASYPDVLKRHIEAFINSDKWVEYAQENGKKVDYELTRSIMMEADVYKPLNDFLKTKGYCISDFRFEKMYYIKPEKLKADGYEVDFIIPLPYSVWIRVTKN